MAVKGSWPATAAPATERRSWPASSIFPRRFRRWRQRRRVSPAWTAVVALVLFVVALPIATVLLLAINPCRQHLAASRLDRAAGSLLRTLLLSGGVAALTFTIGTARRGSSPCTASRAAACSTACWCCRWRCRPTSSPTATWSCSTSPGPCSGRCARCSAGTRCKDYWFPEVRTLARRHAGAVGRALPLCLPLGARELRAAVGVRAGGGAHAGAHARPAPSGRWRCRWRDRRSRPASRWR